LISPHFNLTVELPLKAIVRGYSFRVMPISWSNREVGVSNLKLREQGSRYLYSLLTVWFEWLLTQKDYRRPVSETFEPWPIKVGEARIDDLQPQHGANR
jgi:dolichol-phosphate mannosyltransferase